VSAVSAFSRRLRVAEDWRRRSRRVRKPWSTDAGKKPTSAVPVRRGRFFHRITVDQGFERFVSVDANLPPHQSSRECLTRRTRRLSRSMYKRGIPGRPPRGPDLWSSIRHAQASDKPQRETCRLGPKEIAYLRVDPSTLARDLAILMQTPRKPAEVTATAHRYEIQSMDFFRPLPADLSHRNAYKVTAPLMKLPALAFVIQSEALKVAHHGSEDSTTLDFPRPPSSRQAKKIPVIIRARNFLNACGKLASQDCVRTSMAQFTPLRTETDWKYLVSWGARRLRLRSIHQRCNRHKIKSTLNSSR